MVSLFKDEQAYIPKEVTAFFHIEDMKPGSSRKIDLLCGNKTYAAEISLDLLKTRGNHNGRYGSIY
jgi:hypothetical protein